MDVPRSISRGVAADLSFDLAQSARLVAGLARRLTQDLVLSRDDRPGDGQIGAAAEDDSDAG